MNKEVALKLSAKAKEIAERYSLPNREFNVTNETFTLNKIIPLSEKTAVAIFDKSSRKRAIAFLYWINMAGGSWQYFIPTESHAYGMVKIQKHLQEVEEYNYPVNFQNTL